MATKSNENSSTMRISVLSDVSGIPVARIKFYIREGLLPRGELVQENQAVYGPEHVRRLRLIHALVSIGGVGVSDTRAIFGMLDAREPDIDRTLGATMGAMGGGAVPHRGEATDAAAKMLDRLIEVRGWLIHDDDPARVSVIEAIAGMGNAGFSGLLGHLDAYAQAAEAVAQADLASIAGVSEPEHVLEAAVVGTVLGEVLLGGLRRLAHSDLAFRRFGGDAPGPQGHAMPGQHEAPLPPE